VSGGELIHASAVVLGGAGRAFGAPEDGAVLILGQPGAGKSDLALRLMERGAALLADDQTMLFVENRRLYAEPPESLAGLVEIRGVGIVAFDHASAAPVVLVVELVMPDGIPRLPEPRVYAPPAALGPVARPPLIALAPFEASAPAKIAAAAAHLGGAFLAARD